MGQCKSEAYLRYHEFYYWQGIMSPQLTSLLFLVVGISMAITPWLAAGGQLIASRFELHDVRSLLPVESEVRCEWWSIENLYLFLSLLWTLKRQVFRCLPSGLESLDASYLLGHFQTLLQYLKQWWFRFGLTVVRVKDGSQIVFNPWRNHDSETNEKILLIKGCRVYNLNGSV